MPPKNSPNVLNAKQELASIKERLKSYFYNMDSAHNNNVSQEYYVDACIRDENQLRLMVEAPIVARKGSRYSRY